MIYEALSGVVNELNQHVSSRVGLSEEKIILSSLVNPDGTIPIDIQNKVVATMIYAGKDGAHGNSAATSASFNSATPSGKSGLKLSMYIMFSAHFEERNYEEALKFLSYIVSYMHFKSVFTPQNSDIDSRLTQLEFHIAKMTFTEVSNIWAYLGAKYCPSIIYHMRYVTFDEEYIDGVSSTVTGLGLGSHLR